MQRISVEGQHVEKDGEQQLDELSDQKSLDDSPSRELSTSSSTSNEL